MSPIFSGRGTPWQCGGETEAAGGPAGGEEPGTAQGEKEGKGEICCHETSSFTGIESVLTCAPFGNVMFLFFVGTAAREDE